MNIPFYTFDHIHTAEVKTEIKAAFAAILERGNFINGDYVAQFENEFAAFSGARYGIGVSNGLDALRISLAALGIGKGDEVIVPSNTFIATWLAVADIGATAIPVEPRIDTYNINPELIADKITPKTKAIIPVHLYGQACEMDEIIRIAAYNHLFVLEDNAQSQGARWNNQPTGSIGDIAATSLYPGKNLGALGDGGIITTNSEALAKKVKMIANYGSSKKYYHDVLGTNCRLDTIHAAALSIKLKHLAALNAQRQQIAAFYLKALQGVEDLILPTVHDGATSVWHQFVIRTNRRDELQTYLSEKGIGTLIHYPIPPHLQACYADLGYKKGDFPIAEEMAETCLSLPIWPGMNEDHLKYVTDSLCLFFN